ncbi:MAG: right-handed parallel beta-helix repeat-containing protein [Phycisphaerales bacterium]|nr:right-handed parallel beta-helix repeat-containing protein [Phycisphaerales bacterium]
MFSTRTVIHTSAIWAVVLLLARGAAGQVSYVDPAAVGANNGTSWANAHTSLQSALTDARAPLSTITEVRVAKGTYRPAGPNGNRTISFALINEVAIKGGYAGVTQPAPDERNYVLYATILSADLNGNDATTGNAENSYHVVSAADAIDTTAVLDGFTLTAGNANNATFPNSLGGGIYNAGGDGVISNCVIAGNRASNGGGLYNSSGALRLVNCLFYANTATSNGGAIFNGTASPTFTNLTVVSNTGGAFGSGGIYNLGASANPKVTNCILWNNSDSTGTGEAAQFRILSGTPQVNNCTVMNLGAGGLGGSNNIATDPLFVDALARNYRLMNGSTSINSGNNAPVGGQVAVDLDGSVRLAEVTIDRGPYERAPDCNGNGTRDNLELTSGVGIDCDQNGKPDECQILFNGGAPGGPYFCQANCDVDCDTNGVPDACQSDCDVNGMPDACDVIGGATDCNNDGVLDRCDPDCNDNDVSDVCDIRVGFPDCNHNGRPDVCDIAVGSIAPGGPFFCAVPALCADDCNNNARPDECELAAGDCNENGILDDCDIAGPFFDDCNGNNRPDVCDIDEDSQAPGGPYFCTQNCAADCNDNGEPDSCELIGGDCNDNDIPDDCDLASGESGDCDSNNVPDECQPDGDGDGVINPCDQCPTTAPGVPVRPDGCPQVGACCINNACQNNTGAALCLGFNGVFLGDLLGCTQDPDGDTIVGCADRCPFDGTKTQPGLCGCGVADTFLRGAGDGGCNNNGTPDVCDINSGDSADCNGNHLPDECEIRVSSTAPGGPFFCTSGCNADCNNNGIPDVCDLGQVSNDCNGNSVPDECDVAGGAPDCDGNGVPDSCQPDGDGDGVINSCDQCGGDDALLGDPCDSAIDPDDCVNGVFACIPNIVRCTDNDATDDADADGSFDCHDFCPGTPAGKPVDGNGCPFEGACCTTSGVCFDNPAVTPEQCGEVGGIYQGNGSTCAAGCYLGGDGDCDDDTDVDLDDFELFLGCVGTVLGGLNDPCRCVDLDLDPNIDLIDWSLLQTIIGPCEFECPLCPTGATGDCCLLGGNGTPGCNNPLCCDSVCNVPGLERCCADLNPPVFNGWDAGCALAAARLFPDECGCPFACCKTDGTCQDLTATACAQQGGFPDEGKLCSDADVCGCPDEAIGNCCANSGTPGPGCDDMGTGCCAAVCLINPACCLQLWSPACAQIAQTLSVCECPTVACCLNATPFCQDLTPLQCQMAGGLARGTFSTCAGGSCNPACPANADGSCCAAGGLPIGSRGCDDPSATCCNAVCAIQPFCCLSRWDASCAALAQTLTADCNCPIVTEACCKPDESCVNLTIAECLAAGGESRGPGSVCTPELCAPPCPGEGGCYDANNNTPGCDDEVCCNAVCMIEARCCEIAWNFSPFCIELVQELADTTSECPQP